MGALALAACDSETIDLLPPDATSHTAGIGASGGNPVSSNRGASAGNPSAGETSGGASAGAAGAGGNVSCSGLGCAGFNFGGLGGSIWNRDCDPDEETCALCRSDQHCPERWHCSALLGLCVECEARDDCRPGFACDLGTLRCAPACEDSIDCDAGSVCNPEHGTCVECLNHSDCDFDGDEDTHYCARPQHVCVECLHDADCDDGSRGICAVGNCTKCIFDDDCRPDQYCHRARGRCEP